MARKKIHFILFLPQKQMVIMMQLTGNTLGPPPNRIPLTKNPADELNKQKD